MSIVDRTPRVGLPVYASADDFPWDEDRWPNFSPHEFACKGTGRVAVDPEALDLLQEMRTRIGKPFYVVSGYRSPTHNRHVGGAKHSFHKDGVAFDITMDNHDPYEFKRMAEEVGFDGIGTYPPRRGNFIHVDNRGYRARWGNRF
jgi:uncharacterized protein YcbK (DUF882 family)